MTGLKSLDKFLEFFNSNASGVITTITNQEVNLATKKYADFNFSSIESNLKLPCLLINVNFTGDNDFQMQMVAAKELAASLADLMMLGTGEAEYVAEEHNDALQELLNQVFGSLTTELNAEGVGASGTVTEVQLTDMEIQKEFFSDHKMIELSFQLLSKDAFLYLIFDPASLKALDNSFGKIGGNALAQTQSASSGGGQKKKGSTETVSVSRASFAEIEEVRPSNAKNINLDNLLDIPLPITVELGRKEMRIKEVLELGQGSVLELNKLAGDLVDLMINGKPFAKGEVMVVDENYAIRIVSLTSREERIRALGPE